MVMGRGIRNVGLWIKGSVGWLKYSDMPSVNCPITQRPNNTRCCGEKFCMKGWKSRESAGTLCALGLAEGQSVAEAVVLACPCAWLLGLLERCIM
jgi:hypothetical protein